MDRMLYPYRVRTSVERIRTSGGMGGSGRSIGYFGTFLRLPPILFFSFLFFFSFASFFVSLIRRPLIRFLLLLLLLLLGFFLFSFFPRQERSEAETGGAADGRLLPFATFAPLAPAFYVLSVEIYVGWRRPSVNFRSR